MGATPWRQQVALVLGVVFGALVIPPILTLLNQSFGFQGAPGAGENALAAPQAALISTIAKGVLGAGAEADRHKRLRDLANKQTDDDRKALAEDEKAAASAKDGEASVKVGYAFVTNGDLDKGIAMIEQGIAKGGLKRAEDAKLHLGMAYLQSGNRAKAVQALRSVTGTDGAADLARLWIAHGGRQG